MLRADPTDMKTAGGARTSLPRFADLPGHRLGTALEFEEAVDGAAAVASV